MTSVFERRADPRAGEGGAAFPHTAADGHKDYRPGMTLRDYFAGQALQGMMAHDASGLAQAIWSGVPEAEQALNNTARVCYAVADRMLKAREK